VSEYDDAVDHTGDDLAEWADHELVKALRAPGLDDELTDEQRFLAAFRETAGPSSGPSGAGRKPTSISARRLGAGGTAVVVAVALSGGVAAAYTGNLPDPVQQFAHTVIGAPAPDPETPRAKSGPGGDGSRDPAAPATGSTAPASPSSPPSSSPTPGEPSPSSGGHSGRPSDGPSSKPAVGDPGTSPSTSPSDSPTPVPDPPAAVSMSAASHLVGYGTTMSLAGHLTTADGTPVAGHRIALLVHDASGWSVVLKTTTDSAGDVVTLSRPVTGLQRYRWRVRGHVRSEGWRVRVDSTVAASAEPGTATTTIRATAVGAHTGDTVELYRWLGGQPTMVGQAAVNDAGEAAFEVPTPKRRKVFVVRLVATPDHTAARAKAVVKPPKGEPAPEPSPGTS
jgi:hypothetical protein